MGLPSENGRHQVPNRDGGATTACLHGKIALYAVRKPHTRITPYKLCSEGRQHGIEAFSKGFSPQALAGEGSVETMARQRSATLGDTPAQWATCLGGSMPIGRRQITITNGLQD
jgi:hypothetical protein